MISHFWRIWGGVPQPKMQTSGEPSTNKHTDASKWPWASIANNFSPKKIPRGLSREHNVQRTKCPHPQFTEIPNSSSFQRLQTLSYFSYLLQVFTV
jgi:hypothetical protein